MTAFGTGQGQLVGPWEQFTERASVPLGTFQFCSPFCSFKLFPFSGHRFQKSTYAFCNPYYKNGFILPAILIGQLQILECHSSPWTFFCLFLAVVKNSSCKWVAHRSSLSRLKFYVAYSLCCTRILCWQNFNHLISNLSHTDWFFFVSNSSCVCNCVNVFWILYLIDCEKDDKGNVRCFDFSLLVNTCKI